MLKKTVDIMNRVYGRALSGVKRAARSAAKAAVKIAKGKGGGYLALAVLLCLLAAASISLRNRSAADETLTNNQLPKEALAVQTAAPTPTPVPEPAWIWPLEGAILTSYASDEPVWSKTLEQWQAHPAVDIAGMPGEAVYACRDGVIADAYRDRLWGNVVVIDHGDGWQSTYAGLNTLKLVSVGDAVTMGDVISSVASVVPCEAELAAHIHFSVALGEQAMDFSALAG